MPAHGRKRTASTSTPWIQGGHVHPAQRVIGAQSCLRATVDFEAPQDGRQQPLRAAQKFGCRVDVRSGQSADVRDAVRRVVGYGLLELVEADRVGLDVVLVVPAVLEQETLTTAAMTNPLTRAIRSMPAASARCCAGKFDVTRRNRNPATSAVAMVAARRRPLRFMRPFIDDARRRGRRSAPWPG